MVIKLFLLLFFTGFTFTSSATRYVTESSCEPCRESRLRLDRYYPIAVSVMRVYPFDAE